MKHSDRQSSLFFILFSLGICFSSLRLRTGTIWYSGPMIFPLLLGITLLGLSIALYVQSGTVSHSTVIFQEGEGRKILYLLGIFFLAILLLEPMGFVVSVFLLIATLETGMARKGIKVSIFYGLVISTLTYALFTRVLGTLLPRGVLWFF